MINKIYKIFKDFCLIITGALLGIFPSLFFPILSPEWKNTEKILFILITLAFALFGFGIFDAILLLIKKIIRKINTRRKQIAIIAPESINSENSSWVNIKLTELESELTSFSTSAIKSYSSIDNFPVVVNPYGGVYMEEDVSEFVSFSIILKYVRAGGVFVNIADIPFYYAFDRVLNRRIDTTPFVVNQQTVLERNFYNALISSKLQTFIVGIDKPQKEKELVVERVALLHDSTINFFHKEYSFANGVKGSPIVAIPYGKGYFVFSTISINTNNKSLIKDLLDKTLKLLR